MALGPVRGRVKTQAKGGEVMLGKLFDRFVVYTFTLLVALLIVGAVSWTGYHIYLAAFAPEMVAVASTTAHPRPETYQVLSGDTLWQIATEHYPGKHTGEIVGEIRKANGLGSATIYPNQVLKLPEVE